MNKPQGGILLIQTAFIGDAILATAMAESIHQAQPHTPVDLLVRQDNESLFANHPYIRQVLVWNKKRHKYKNLIGILKQIRQTRYHAVVNAQRFAATGLLTALSGAAIRSGYSVNPLSLGFTHKYPHSMQHGHHETQRNHTLLQPLGQLPSSAPRLYPTPQQQQQAQKLAPPKPFVCIAPASVWFTKQWPAAQWIKLINALPPSTAVVLIGGPTDAPLCQQIATQAKRQVHNLAGQLSLLASAALMKQAVLNYVNDSAPMHLCSAVDAPVCAIYCSTVPSFGFGPLSSFSRIGQVQTQLSCRPCGLHGHQQCPLEHFNCAHISIDLLLQYYHEAAER